MTVTRARPLAWSLWSVFLATQALVGWFVASHGTPPDDLVGLVVIGFATMGALVASRRPENAVGWLLLAVAVSFGVQNLADAYAELPSPPALGAVAWIASWSWYLWGWLLAVMLPLVFPDGRLLSSRWRSVVWVALAALVLSMVGDAFSPGQLDVAVEIDNPYAVTGTAGDIVSVLGSVGDLLTVAVFLLPILSMVLRYRRSNVVVRQQIKWFSLAGISVIAGLVLAALGETRQGGWLEVMGAVGWFTFLFAALIGIPVATGIAILRHRLYDIDLVINRALVYGSLTAALVTSYLGIVLVLRLVTSPWTGESDLAVAASTLTVAALFRPLRARIQRTVDRRFYRARYDAGRTLDTFSGRLRDELDLDTLGDDLRRVVSETLQPAHVSLWVREEPS